MTAPIRLLTAIAACALPALAAAQDSAPVQRTFSLPAGCTAFLTLQTSACSVTHYFTCENDPEGWQRRVDLDEGGVVYFGAIDSETQWMESFHVMSGHSERLEPDPVDRASFTDLLANGIDTYDFRTLSDEIGETRYVGQDRLTGEQVVIDGVTLDRTEYAIRAYDAAGNEIWRSSGNEYISRDWRFFMSGTSKITTPTDSWESSDDPVEFILPGEPGFLSVSPKHGCGVVLSSAPLGHALQEYPDDPL